MNDYADAGRDSTHTRNGDAMSPLRVWLHPARTCRSLLEALADAERSRRIYAMTEEEAERLRADNRALTSRLAESENEREKLESRLRQMKDDEEYQLEMDLRMAEIEKEFEKVEGMKRRYEATIATLKEKLRGANEELRRLSGQRDEIDIMAPYDPDREPAAATLADRRTKAGYRRQDPGTRRTAEEESLKSAKPDVPVRPVVVDGRGIPSDDDPLPPVEEKIEERLLRTPFGKGRLAADEFAPRRLDGTEWIPSSR